MPWDQDLVELSFTAFKYERSPSNVKCKQLNGLMKCFKHTVYSQFPFIKTTLNWLQMRQNKTW